MQLKVSIDKNSINRKSKIILNECEDLYKLNNRFISVIDNINTAWSGADALKYINTLKEKYVTELNNLTDVVNEYGIYMKNVPEAYDILDEIFESETIDV